MSESAVILEGEVARRFNPVDKLRATNQDSSVSDWVPSDTLDLGNLMASENTLYLANIDDDCDAYEEVEVDVSEELEDGDYKKITGKGDDGNDYAVGLDENGNLTSEMVPSAIHIAIKPRKLEYEEGETLDFTGIHVYLMDGNNQRFTSEDYPTGEIPFEELLLPVTIADGEGGGGSSETFIDVDGLNNPLCLWNINEGSQYHVYWDQENPYYYYVSELEATAPVYILKLSRMNEEGYISVNCSTESFRIKTQRQTPPSWDPQINISGSRQTTYGGHSVHITTPMVTSRDNVCNLVPASPAQEIAIQNVAVLALTEGREIGQNTVPVQWLRSDGETLEDSFSIEINPGTNSTPSESDSGSGHTSGGF